MAVALEGAEMDGVGLDIETWVDFPVDPNALKFLFSEEELTLLGKDRRVLALAFSANESFYKAVHRQGRAYVEFHAVRVIRVDWANAFLWLEQCCDLHPTLPAGRRHIVSFRPLDKTHCVTCLALFRADFF